MKILFLSPGFPTEMTDFVRGLAQTGAEVIGMGDQDESAVPHRARTYLSAYFPVRFDDEEACVDTAVEIARRLGVDRVESLWEPLMILAARIRGRLGLPGLTVTETVPFRDKEDMKATLDAAGIRTPHHYRARTAAEVRAAIDKIGFPVIVKPIAGAGSASTYRLNGAGEIDAILEALGDVHEVSVEEFVEGEEFTFDTICAGGRALFHNICWYRPRPLIGRQNEWISQETVVLRDPDVDHLAAGRAMGHRVLDALGFRNGFTHMEWYLTSDGEAVFGEIGARPPGGRTVDAMNWASDVDLFRWWAEAVVIGEISEPLERRFNAVTIFKRAVGEGRITAYVGLDHLLTEFGEWVAAVELNPIGAPRRDWRAQLAGDGMIAVRHPDLDQAVIIADRFASELVVRAG